MKLDRILLGGLVAIGIAGPALAQGCLQPAEKAALDTRALQSQLMVAALSCGQHDAYNAFVTRYQKGLGSAYKVVTAHFRRVNGAHGQRELDNFITNMANAQSQEGIRQGSFFCRNVAPLFEQAMAQPDLAGLAELSVNQKVVNPYGLEACPIRTAQAATPARRANPPLRTAAVTTASR
jgi:hypothetical protein